MGEAENAVRFADNFAHDEHVKFPCVYPDASGRFVLTLEFLHGKKLDDALEAGFDRKLIAHRAIGVVIKQILDDGFFSCRSPPRKRFDHG